MIINNNGHSKITGTPGTGKTEALKKIQSLNNNESILYVSMIHTDSKHSVSDLFGESIGF